MANISAKINVSLVSKEKLFKGAKGTYLNVVLIETPNGQYGDFMIVEESTPAERSAKTKGKILGNASYFGQRQQSQPRTQQQNRSAQSAAGASDGPPDDGGDVPF